MPANATIGAWLTSNHSSAGLPVTASLADCGSAKREKSTKQRCAGFDSAPRQKGDDSTRTLVTLSHSRTCTLASKRKGHAPFHDIKLLLALLDARDDAAALGPYIGLIFSVKDRRRLIACPYRPIAYSLGIEPVMVAHQGYFLRAVRLVNSVPGQPRALRIKRLRWAGSLRRNSRTSTPAGT